MPVSKYWESVDDFPASDAAFLILGIEPDATLSESHLGHRHLLQRMHRAFLETCAHFRYCLERVLDPELVSSWAWQLEGEPDLVVLPSVEMSDLNLQFENARNRRELDEYRHIALFWLERALDQFDRQRFNRESLSSWLYWSELHSEFDFKKQESDTPEKRRSHVRRVVEECEGNKSEAARRLGISRTRVDQLLAGPKGTSNPLQAEPQGPGAHDPFSLGRS